MSDSERNDASQIITDLHVQATYRLTEALVASETRMRRRLELLNEIVVETGAGGELVFLNPAWTRTTGIPIEASLGQLLRSFVVPEDLPLFDGASAGAPAVFRLRGNRGADIWVEYSFTAIPAGGAVGALRDITLQKQAQEQLSMLSLVASMTDNIVIITDRSGRIEYVNQSFQTLTGYSPEEVLGRKPGSFLQGQGTDPQDAARLATAIRDGLSCSTEILNYTRHGKPYWITMQITPIHDASGQLVRFISVQTECTELVLTRRELESAKVRAEAASQAKTLFLATVSHEMRTPLQVIIGSADFALSGKGGLAALEPHVKRIQNNSEILLSLINDILDVSKIEAGQIDLEQTPITLRPLLAQAVDASAQRAAAKGLAFHIDVDSRLPDAILSDPGRLRQIVNNLCENAVKFTAQGEVNVRAALAGDAASPLLEIRVRDTGEGVPAEARSRIFDRFEQADISIRRRKGGIGLGLSIVKSLCEALGGSVSLSCPPAGGAEFLVQLPLIPAAPKEERECKGFTAPAPARGASILVAEDSDDSYLITSLILTNAGYDVDRAVTGVEAYQAARAIRYDVILLDLEMPETDGLEAARQIRLDERAAGAPPVPIIALTAHVLREYRDRCLDAGFNGYLAKPIRQAELLDAVSRALTAEVAL